MASTRSRPPASFVLQSTARRWPVLSLAHTPLSWSCKTYRCSPMNPMNPFCDRVRFGAKQSSPLVYRGDGCVVYTRHVHRACGRSLADFSYFRHHHHHSSEGEPRFFHRSMRARHGCERTSPKRRLFRRHRVMRPNIMTFILVPNYFYYHHEYCAQMAKMS